MDKLLGLIEEEDHEKLIIPKKKVDKNKTCSRKNTIKFKIMHGPNTSDDDSEEDSYESSSDY